ncbi:DMT family transporter [Gynuella sunshinyii]|uniref:Permeases of the drug/metabolite transporter (DMT) superfamily n=1 Tax=Gynuella sunshinyii YC6258 TaxID=1445510 RepID=A0A0C5VJ62_9GAMM|nr:EamA family transporter [Gynuella sunshinyii]AJQ93438.1 permeases of the drug/metabolite transporter (DMT) superfamily [Gynuella sunshinyii YC6258]
MHTSRATLIGLFSVFLWGTLALLTRLTDGLIPPLQLVAMTFGLAYLLMQIRWFCLGHTGVVYLRLSWQAWLVGVGGLFGYHLCYFYALNHAPAAQASLLAYLWPVLIVLLSALLPAEKLLKRHLLGVTLAALGGWLLLSDPDQGLQPAYAAGYAAALACAFIWSGYSVLSRRLKSVPTDAVGWYCLATALLALGCHWLLEPTVWPASARSWFGIVALGIGPVGIAFFTWDYGVKHGHIQLLGIASYAAPLISTVLLIIAGEAHMSDALISACALIIPGSLIAAGVLNVRMRTDKTGVSVSSGDIE